MTREDEQKICNDYCNKFGEGFNFPPLDFGYGIVTIDQLYEYAKAAIESGKPINWRDILGAPITERIPGVLT